MAQILIIEERAQLHYELRVLEDRFGDQVTFWDGLSDDTGERDFAVAMINPLAYNGTKYAQGIALIEELSERGTHVILGVYRYDAQEMGIEESVSHCVDYPYHAPDISMAIDRFLD